MGVTNGPSFNKPYSNPLHKAVVDKAEDLRQKDILEKPKTRKEDNNSQEESTRKISKNTLRSPVQSSIEGSDIEATKGAKKDPLRKIQQSLNNFFKNLKRKI